MTGLEQVRGAAKSQGGLLRDLLVENVGEPVFDEFAAKAPRSAANAAAYATVLESVLEGYLLHHGEPRIFASDDGDLRVLAGDYLYAYGLERLTGLGDLFAVAELSELISRCSQAELATASREAVADLWLASAVRILCTGDAASGAIGTAKMRANGGRESATEGLVQIATRLCGDSGLAREAVVMHGGIAAALSSPIAL